MRLIDAETMKNSLCGPCCRNEKCSTIEECRKNGCGMMAVIDHQPTIEAEPVQHGRWIPIEYDSYADGAPVWDKWECSYCRHEHEGVEDTLTAFCPHCGAKMDGGAEQ